jgi:hypothetical protein
MITLPAATLARPAVPRRRHSPAEFAPAPLASTSAHALALPASVTWTTDIERATPRSELATPLLLDRELYAAAPIRTAHRYPRQKNIQGLYYFASTGRHVWHESQLESMVMRWLDMQDDIVAISAQPMRIDFADGTSHTPDFLALHSDHRQVVYDVKPLRFLPKFEAQFAKTRAFCDHVGFEYEVHHELPKQVAVNLSWLAGFKHHGYRPPAEPIRALLRALDQPMPMREAVDVLDGRNRPRGRSGLFHLVWSRVLDLDMTLPISNRTLIERTAQ